MNLRTAITKLLDFEWGRREIDLSNIDREITILRNDIKRMKEGITERREKGKTMASKLEFRFAELQIELRKAVKNFDQMDKRLNDMLGSIRAERLRISSLENNDTARAMTIATIGQDLDLIKNRKVPRSDPIPRKEEKLAPDSLNLVEAVFESISRIIKAGDGTVKPIQIREMAQSFGDYKDESVATQIAPVLRSIAWSHKEFYNYTPARGLFPQRHGILPLQLSRKQLKKDWAKWQSVHRKKR